MTTVEGSLPSSFDVIVIGTGLVESIVAAAASRIGKKVLHMDGNEYYGSMWSTFSFDAMRQWTDDRRNGLDINFQNLNLFSNNEKVFQCVDEFSLVSNVSEKWFSGHETWNEETIMKLSRKFNLDLAPKFTYSRGPMVDLLIHSNIARYAEFRCCTRVLEWFENGLMGIPLSRGDVVVSTVLDLFQKRYLMKMIEQCSQTLDVDELNKFSNISEYMKSKNITGKVAHFMFNAIAMTNEETPCTVAVERVKRFVASLGRYGKGPFLWPMYGSGELPQCFCRLCAVFGGVYHLMKTADQIVTDGSKYVEIVSGGQRLSSHHLVVSVGNAPVCLFKEKFVKGLSRGIFIIDRSICASDKEELSFVRFPYDNDSIQMIELGPATHACPDGLYVLHMTCRQRKSAEEDLQQAVTTLLRQERRQDAGDGVSSCLETGREDDRPVALWSVYFNMPDTSEYELARPLPENMHLASGPNLDFDFDFAVQQARDIFEKMFPGAEFLPRAPDPDDIVMDVVNESDETENVKITE